MLQYTYYDIRPRPEHKLLFMPGKQMFPVIHVTFWSVGELLSNSLVSQAALILF